MYLCRNTVSSPCMPMDTAYSFNPSQWVQRAAGQFRHKLLPGAVCGQTDFCNVYRHDVVGIGWG